MLNKIRCNICSYIVLVADYRLIRYKFDFFNIIMRRGNYEGITKIFRIG